MTEQAGYQRVILQVSDEFFAFAEAMAQAGGYFGPADYLNAILNTAILAEIDNAAALPRRDDEKLIVEDDGGGLRLVDDIDYDIPF
jgi:hypothetical protein